MYHLQRGLRILVLGAVLQWKVFFLYLVFDVLYLMFMLPILHNRLREVSTFLPFQCLHNDFSVSICVHFNSTFDHPKLSKIQYIDGIISQ